MKLPDLRWAIAIASLDPVEGHEEAGARRVLCISNEAFHQSGLVTICPITAAWSVPRHPGEVAIPSGHAGQTKDAIILCHQVRTISISRVKGGSLASSGRPRYVTDPEIRASVRTALRHHLGLDIPPGIDGAAGET